MLVFYPPEIKHRLTWRGLYVDGAFAQRELDRKRHVQFAR